MHPKYNTTKENIMSDVKVELLKIAQSIVENNLYRKLEEHNYQCQVEGQPLPYPKVEITVDDIVNTAKDLERKFINSSVQSLRG